MNRLSGYWPSLVIIILSLFIIYGGLKRQTSTANKYCIKPFPKFAYLPDESERPIPVIRPGPPWQFEAAVPRPENTTYHFTDIQIELARSINGEQEIWLFKNPFDSWTGTYNRTGSFVVYYPQSQTWAEISAIIGDTNLIVSDLFVTSDGTLWGLIGRSQPHPVPTTGPILGRFNESTQQFEAAPGGLEIPIIIRQRSLSEPLEMVLDREGIFWIFGPNNGIYRYDPKTVTTERQTNLPTTEISALSNVLASPSGTIVFKYSYWSGSEEFLFQFFPETGGIVPLDIPREPWEAAGGMLVDHKGRLWLGAMGYMETDGSLHLLHRNAPNAWNYSEPYWYPPTLLFESSNGVLWYAEHHDMGQLGEGTAWYDPETGEGCLFTNLASYIVEDTEKQLWIVVEGELYRYPLEQESKLKTAIRVSS